MRMLKDKLNWKNIVEAASFLVVLMSVFCSIRMNIVGRTLWLDEAMLAISLNKRSLFTMFLSPLEWNQSAPVGYLACVKIIINILGNSEAAFRAFSILAFVGVLIVFYVLCKKVLNVKFPMLCTAGIANIAFLLEYSNMLKPYICDALCVLLVLLIYYLYREKKIKLWTICVTYAVLIWFSNPVAFFAGGVVAYEVISALIHRDKKLFWRGIAVGICICASFLLMYLVWLRPTIATTNLSEFWTGYEFPLLICNRDVLNWALYLIKFVTQGVGPAWKVVLLLAILAILINIFRERNPYIWAITIAGGLTLLASNLGFFPMSDRLFLFIVPVLVLLAVFSLRWLLEFFVKPEFIRPLFALAMAFFVISGTGIQTYHTGVAYREGEEANQSIEYIRTHLTAEDLIYVYYPAIPVFQYKMGYDTTSVGGYEDNVYLGHGFFCKDGGSPEDIAYISQQKGIYVLFSHVVDYEPTDNLMNVLNATGTLEKIYDPYLFYYSCDGSQSKADFSYRVLSQKTEGDVCTAEIEIVNDGDTYLNNGMETFAFRDMDEEVQNRATVPVQDIAPGTSVTVTVSFAWEGRDEVSFSLYDEDKYDLASIGVEPCVIRK